MDNGDVPYRQSAHEALTILNGQWTVAVLSTLAVARQQFSRILTEINDVEARVGWSSHSKPLTRRVLTDTLYRALDNGLIERDAEGGKFDAVWYQLTTKGRELLQALGPLARWAQRYREDVTQ